MSEKLWLIKSPEEASWENWSNHQ